MKREGWRVCVCVGGVKSGTRSFGWSLFSFYISICFALLKNVWLQVTLIRQKNNARHPQSSLRGLCLHNNLSHIFWGFSVLNILRPSQAHRHVRTLKSTSSPSSPSSSGSWITEPPLFLFSWELPLPSMSCLVHLSALPALGLTPQVKGHRITGSTMPQIVDCWS